MRAEELHRLATDTALELPHATLSYPFGPDWEVYKVAGKVFLLLTESAGPQMATFKVEPREGRSLVETYSDVIPGYHMNKTHWATVLGTEEESGGLPADELDELIVSSYLLVLAKLPRSQRPVDPFAFGAARDRRLGRSQSHGTAPHSSQRASKSGSGLGFRRESCEEDDPPR